MQLGRHETEDRLSEICEGAPGSERRRQRGIWREARQVRDVSLGQRRMFDSDSVPELSTGGRQGFQGEDLNTGPNCARKCM